MSLLRCDNCGRVIATGAEPEAFDEVANRWFCRPCREAPVRELKAMLARVYVFRNGIKGGGTLRFQPDVFDHPPGDPAYSPLRTVTVVTWKNTHSARVLTSAAEVQAASAIRELDTDELGVVVNMPLVTWPGGQR